MWFPLCNLFDTYNDTGKRPRPELESADSNPVKSTKTDRSALMFDVDSELERLKQELELLHQGYFPLKKWAPLQTLT